jgi:hypothetical protein
LTPSWDELEVKEQRPSRPDQHPRIEIMLETLLGKIIPTDKIPSFGECIVVSIKTLKTKNITLNH